MFISWHIIYGSYLGNKERRNSRRFRGKLKERIIVEHIVKVLCGVMGLTYRGFQRNSDLDHPTAERRLLLHLAV